MIRIESNRIEEKEKKLLLILIIFFFAARFNLLFCFQKINGFYIETLIILLIFKSNHHLYMFFPLSRFSLNNNNNKYDNDEYIFEINSSLLWCCLRSKLKLKPYRI